jgi:hypothetical protein
MDMQDLGKGGPAVAGVEHSNAIKSNTKRYESKTTPGGETLLVLVNEP